MRRAGEIRGRLATIAAAVACAGAVLPASALAITDTITAVDGDAYEGASGSGGEFLLDAGDIPAFVNSDPTAEHNVVATADGPDGEKLFQTPLIADGGSVDLVGARYLGPGDYGFLCTIHTGMSGRLAVEGADALPRPSVDVAIISTKLAKVRRGRLKVSVSAATASADVDLAATLGARPLASASGLDLAAGQTRRVTLPLKNRARKLLKDLDEAGVKLAATVPFGASDMVKRKLK